MLGILTTFEVRNDRSIPRYIVVIIPTFNAQVFEGYIYTTTYYLVVHDVVCMTYPNLGTSSST